MYRKPVIMTAEDLAEGVYLASGCYTTTAEIRQTPETGRGDYRIQVNGDHKADHTRNKQLLTISFNMPVTYKSCSEGNLESGSGTSTLLISLSYTQNKTDSIGFGDLVVQADSGLAITSVKITD